MSGHWSTFIESRVVTDYNADIEDEVAALPGGENIHRVAHSRHKTNRHKRRKNNHQERSQNANGMTKEIRQKEKNQKFLIFQEFF